MKEKEIIETKVLTVDGVTYTLKIKRTSKGDYNYVTCMSSDEYKAIVETPEFNLKTFKEGLTEEKIIVSQSCPPEDGRTLKDIKDIPPSELVNEIKNMVGLPGDIIYMYANGFAFARTTLNVIKEYLENNIYLPGNSLSDSKCKIKNSQINNVDILEQKFIHSPDCEKIIEIPRECGKNRHKCTLNLTDEEEKMYQDIVGAFTLHNINRILSKFIIEKFRELKPYSDMENLKFAYPMQEREFIEKRHKGFKTENDSTQQSSSNNHAHKGGK